MAETPQSPQQTEPHMVELNITDVADGSIPKAVLAADSQFNPDHRLASIDRRRARDMAVFPIEQETLTSLPRPNHWSIAWSDLMMTMFVLFFVLFIHATEETRQVVPPEKVERQPVRSAIISYEKPATESGGKGQRITSVAPSGPQQKEEPRQPVVVDARSDTPIRHPLKAPSYTAPGSVGEVVEVVDNNDAIKKNRQSGKEEQSSRQQPLSVEEVYSKGQQIVEQNRLENFAAINLAPDKTVRLTLTGDLLFPSAQATLTPAARNNMEMLAEIIAHTPYIVNVEGHTDNRPIASSRFPSNWELSLARANSVARFLIDSIGLDPSQVVISGFSSYRPAASNETEQGRAANRRVEIILSQPGEQSSEPEDE